MAPGASAARRPVATDVLMARVVVPGGRDPLAFVWGDLAPALSGPAAAYSSAVYERSSLSLREFESARITIAGINQCVLCLGWRTARDVPGRSTDPAAVPDSFYDDVVAHRWDSLSARERLAAEFAERYASDHLGMDDDLWDRLHAQFSDAELVDLGLCVASWLALGRFNQVFDIDGACRVPSPAP
jgi:alkylhydroperoxidase family enzyme